MPTAKRKATASPALSIHSDAGDDDAPLDIDPSPLDAIDSARRKRPNNTSLQPVESSLRHLSLDTLERFLLTQKRRCLETLVGNLPPTPSTSAHPITSTGSTLVGADEEATTSRVQNGAEGTSQQASACVGFEEEWYTLHSMLHATVTAQESNSCLLIGASGSGKTLLVDSVLNTISSAVKTKAADVREEKPYYHVHLAGSVQINDRSAMKEMAQQLILQGAFTEEDVSEAMHSPSLDGEDDDENPPNSRSTATDHVFGGEGEDEEEEDTNAIAAAAANEEAEIQDELAGAILSSLNNIIRNIIALLSNTSSSGSGGRKPLVITLDDFDLFTARPRQAMLYCLLDAVQAASYGAGLAVVGLTSRVDTVDLLEKRVKSRFSHRIVHVRPPSSYEVFERIVLNALSPSTQSTSTMAGAEEEKFLQAWQKDVSTLFSHPHFRDVLRGIYELSNDIRTVYRILTPTISRLSVLDPTFDLEHILETASTEIGDGMIHILRDLTEPEIALLIAVKHLQTRDRQVFNFEMCFDELRRFAARDTRERQAASTASTSTNTTGGGAAFAIPFYADRKIVLMSFHSLLSLEILLPQNYVSTLTISNPVAKPAATVGSTQTGRANQNTIRKEFWKVRCILSPPVIVAAVKDRLRQVPISSSLVKWAGSHG
ncbi:related to Origin recognition complex subunit 4 [Ustilago bromivora]|uniref:Origin recognition complex subunit 4 n=1 Tax=Ustilago bromivora TaxID=307758 RepID=A0A1K0GGT9_9BASI|nr:related to Origin recognition complex subunit 4 [Ustilago bromivora]SYW77783.1 related to Origin recognition complex subunit 4 [Ustilago bromivora]